MTVDFGYLDICDTYNFLYHAEDRAWSFLFAFASLLACGPTMYLCTM